MTLSTSARYSGQHTRGVAALVRGYRERIARDPDLYEGDIDVIMWLVNDTPHRDWSPSEVARAAKVSTSTAQQLLAELALGRHIARDERGAWSRYWARR